MRMARVVVMYLQTFGRCRNEEYNVDGYNAYVFIGNELKSARFKDTVHQVCMSHAKNKLSRLPIRVVNRLQNAFRNFKGVLYEGA